MQDLYAELQKNIKLLDKSIKDLKAKGQEKARAERDYRVALAQKILTLRAGDKPVPVTIINDLARGDDEIAELKMQRDIADSMYETCQQQIYATKLNINLLENQIEREWKS